MYYEITWTQDGAQGVTLWQAASLKAAEKAFVKAYRFRSVISVKVA